MPTAKAANSVSMPSIWSESEPVPVQPDWRLSLQMLQVHGYLAAVSLVPILVDDAAWLAWMFC